MSKNTIIGIYSITNVLNNKKYIGSSFDIIDRWRSHRVKLNNNKSNQKLQNAWNKYGADNFYFEIIEQFTATISKEQLEEYEQYWIDFYKSFTKQGYNIRQEAKSNKGMKILDTTNMTKASRERNSVKCLLYNLDGTFFKLFFSLGEIDTFLNKSKGSSCNALKSKSNVIGQFIIKPFEENYQLKIEAYNRTSIFKNKEKRSLHIKDIHTGKIVSNATKINMSVAKQTMSTISHKPVIQLDLTGKTINQFISISQASRNTGISRNTIKRALETQQYNWKFKHQNINI